MIREFFQRSWHIGVGEIADLLRSQDLDAARERTLLPPCYLIKSSPIKGQCNSQSNSSEWQHAMQQRVEHPVQL